MFGQTTRCIYLEFNYTYSSLTFLIISHRDGRGSEISMNGTKMTPTKLEGFP